MLRVLKKSRHWPLLYQYAMLHHGRTICKPAHQRQVVRDQQDCHPRLALQITEQLQHLHAQRYIQCRGGLVCQQQFRFGSQRHRNHGALTLPTAELVRIALCAAFRLWNTSGRQQLHRLPPCLLLAQRLFELQHLSHLSPHSHQRVQRRHRFLKDHGHITAAHCTHFSLRQREQISTIEQGLPADMCVFRKP